MAAMAYARGTVGIVSEERVVFAVVCVWGARVAEQVAGGELVQREQHVVDDRVPHGGSFGKGKVVGVASPQSVDGGGIVEEGVVLLGLVGVEGSHGPGGFEGCRGPSRRSWPGVIRACKVLHRWRCQWGWMSGLGSFARLGRWSILRAAKQRQKGKMHAVKCFSWQPVARAAVREGVARG